MAEQVSSLKTDIKYKDTPIGKIPVDWEVVALSRIAEINMGQSPPSKDCNEKGDGIPFYQGTAEFGSKYPSPQKWCNLPKKVADKGDILISVRAPVGEINIALHKCCIGRGIAAVRAREAYDGFLYYALLLQRKALQIIAQSSRFETINSKELSALLISLPPLQEQKKIYKILATVDKAIDKTTQIIEKTNELKKGLIHTIQKGQKQSAELLVSVSHVVEKESTHKKYLEILRKGLMRVLLSGKVRGAYRAPYLHVL